MICVAPSRGRGLKLGEAGQQIGRAIDAKSVAPSRGRGLKQRFMEARSMYGSSPLHGGVD